MNVAVLLAAYNGKNYIKEQILSILNQESVNITLFISVDFSSDDTFNIISKLEYSNVKLLSYGEKYGSSQSNFYRLFNQVDVSSYDFISLSDQDDIWTADKLITGINFILSNNISGFSSSPTAFWPNGKRVVINKSMPQKKYDYLYESAGPGCTYIMTSSSFNLLKSKLDSSKYDLYSKIPHDWLIYAFYRHSKLHWHISPISKILYRQHENNDVGANYGVAAKLNRILSIFTGKYFKNLILIREFLNMPNDKISLLKFNISNLFEIRRNFVEGFVVFPFLLYIVLFR